MAQRKTHQPKNPSSSRNARLWLEGVTKIDFKSNCEHHQAVVVQIPWDPTYKGQEKPLSESTL